MVWKKRNAKAFDRIEKDLTNIRYKWIHTFDALLLRHDIYEVVDDFGKIIDHLIDM